jgi:hypothetical protein
MYLRLLLLKLMYGTLHVRNSKLNISMPLPTCVDFDHFDSSWAQLLCNVLHALHHDLAGATPRGAEDNNQRHLTAGLCRAASCLQETVKLCSADGWDKGCCLLAAKRQQRL